MGGSAALASAVALAMVLHKARARLCPKTSANPSPKT